MSFNGNGWAPQYVTRFISSIASAAGTAIVDTDCGEGYLKALGNKESPHILACELVGSLLADWLELSTLDFALIEITPDDDIPFHAGGRALPGPAFISRAEPTAFPWSGKAEELKRLHNRLDISGLVTLDTWTLNCDRYAPDGQRKNLDNVLCVQYEGAGNATVLKAMDFTHAFSCGRDLNKRINTIDKVKDGQIYGLFPEFGQFLDRQEVKRIADRLSDFPMGTAKSFVARIPREWQVDDVTKQALSAMITQRAQHVSQTIQKTLWPQLALSEEAPG